MHALNLDPKNGESQTHSLDSLYLYFWGCFSSLTEQKSSGLDELPPVACILASIYLSERDALRERLRAQAGNHARSIRAGGISNEQGSAKIWLRQLCGLRRG